MTRRLVFPEVWAPFKSLNLFSAFCRIPWKPEDGTVAKICHDIDGPVTVTRGGYLDHPQVYLAITTDAESSAMKRLKTASRGDVVQQRAAWTGTYSDARWQRSRIIQEIRETDDFYHQKIVQVKMFTWAKSRVVLLGHAGYCTSPITGLGTSTTIVGAYVLAGELAKHSDDIECALASYETVLRPFVEKVQEPPAGVPRIGLPRSNWGIWILHLVLGLIAVLRIDRLLQWGM